MCSVTAAVGTLATIVGVGAVKKKQAKEQEAAYKAGQSSSSTTTEADSGMGWWNQPQSSEGIDSKYRLNKESATSRLLATKGTSQLRNNPNRAARTTGQDASKQRKRLTI